MKIGIISPANNCLKVFPKRCELGVKNFRDIGIETVFAKNAIRYNSCSNDSLKDRVKEFNEILDSDIDLIMATIGGYTSSQLLDKIDYSKIKEKNVPICGFSDITALLLAAYTKTNVEMLYGPVFTVNLCEYDGIDEYTKQSLLDVMEGKAISYKPSKYVINEFIDWAELETKKRVKKRLPKEDDWVIINNGSAKGKLIGGNLATLLLILGSEYLPINSFDNKILFLEECNTNIDEFCSRLESLRYKGILDKVKGIIIGKFDNDEMNDKINDFLSEYMKPYKIPVICNVDFGHVYPILTIPIGRMAELKCKNNKIEFNIQKK